MSSYEPMVYGNSSTADLRNRPVIPDIEQQYPAEVLERLKGPSYTPWFIRFLHHGGFLTQVKQACAERTTSLSARPKIALEISNQALGWLKAFLEAEKEYREQGTIGGKTPKPEQLTRLKEYRQTFSDHTHLAEWCLYEGWEVVCLEHDDASDWSRRYQEGIVTKIPPEEVGRASMLVSFITAIRRDRHFLEVIDRERPDIVITGFYHALKLDALLERDGRTTCFYYSGVFRWSSTIQCWRESFDMLTRLEAVR